MEYVLLEANVAGWLDAFSEASKIPGKADIVKKIENDILNHPKVKRAMEVNKRDAAKAKVWVRKYAKSYESLYDEDVSMATQAQIIGFIIAIGIAMVAGYILGAYLIPVTMGPFAQMILAHGVGFAIGLYTNHRINVHILSRLKSKEGIEANKWYEHQKAKGGGGLGDSTAAMQKFFDSRRRH